MVLLHKNSLFRKNRRGLYAGESSIMNQKQKEVIRDILDPNGTKRKRILGISGTGKSTIIKECIHKLTGNNKTILLTYKNITLIALYIDDINYNDVLITHIDMLEYRMQARNFDYIFVDEAQDFKIEEIEYLIRHLSEDGKIVLFADRNQNVYYRRQEKDDNETDGLYPVLPKGEFKGRWVKLNEVYRKNNGIQSFANDFIRNVYQDRNIESVYKNPSCNYPFSINFIDLKKDIIPYFVQIAKRIPKKHHKNVTFLFDNVHAGYYFEQQLNQEGISTMSTCYNQYSIDAYDKRRKIREKFRLNTDNIKISTIKSFKGLSSKDVFLYLMNNGPNYDEMYVGLTRATETLTVISNNKKLNKFAHEYLKNAEDFLKEIHELEFKKFFYEKRNKMFKNNT